MALKSNVYKQSVKKVGYWNYKDLYNFSFGWLKDNNYKISEKEYTEKNPEVGKEIVLVWEAAKRVTDYFKNTISIKWHILAMNSAEIERAGVVEKTNKGEVKIEVSADLIKDYEDAWEKKPLIKFFRGIYDSYVIKRTTDEYEDRLIDDAKEFIEQIKSFLEL